MAAKKRHEANLLTYLGNPENEFPKRKFYPEILKITKKTLYRHFTPVELREIEKKAVDIRRSASSRQRVKVLDSMYKKACGFSHPDVHVLSNRVKTFDKNGLLLTEETKALLVDIKKVYPPDKAAAQEFFDRTEGKVPMNIDAKLIGDLTIELVNFCDKEKDV